MSAQMSSGSSTPERPRYFPNHPRYFLQCLRSDQIRSDLVQRLRHVCPDVLGVLHAAREAHQVVLDADLGALLGPLVPVADHGGLLDQALHTTQAGRDVGQLAGVDEGGCLPQVALDLRVGDEQRELDEAGGVADRATRVSCVQAGCSYMLLVV